MADGVLRQATELTEVKMSRREAAGSKRAPLNMRTTPEMRDRLEAAAAARGLSITQEVIRRIELSFEIEGVQDRESNKASTNYLVRMIRGVVSTVEAKSKAFWKDDPATAMLCEGAISGIVEVMVKPLPSDLLKNKLTGKDLSEDREKIVEIGKSMGRIYAQDRLMSQVDGIPDVEFSISPDID